MSGSTLPFFSIVIPVLNEERHIRHVLASMLSQIKGCNAEILVLDGGSTDATAAIAASVAVDHPMLRVIDNPGRTQAAACNLAAELVASQSRVLLRVDAHAFYPQGFVLRTLQALSETGASSVVVPMRTIGIGAVQRAIAAAQNSRLGNGGSSHRRSSASRFVDHGHHAAFDIDFFRSIGGYDPGFTHNEDAELDVRAHAAGGRVWLCSEAMIDYVPRDRLRTLASQYIRHGRGRARTTRKHGLGLRLRQCLPLVLLGAVLLGLSAPLLPWLGLPAALYLGACLLWGVAAAARQRDPALLLMGPAACVMHLSWAIGFLDGWLRGVAPKPAGHRDLLPAAQPARMA